MSTDNDKVTLSSLIERSQDSLPEPYVEPPVASKPKLQSPKLCNGCGQEVITYLSALHKKYHPTCFRCVACHEIIDPSQPFAFVYHSVFQGENQKAFHEDREEERDGIILCQSTSDNTARCSSENNIENINPDAQDEKLPLHSHCYAELFGIKCCVCFMTLAPDPVSNRISYIRHAFFENEKVCTAHDRASTRRCTGCHRFEPLSNGGFADIGDADRCLCMSCCRTVITDHESARPLWGEIITFMEHTLHLPIWNGMRNIPILVVNSSDLQDSQRMLSSHQDSNQIMTRGMCLSEQTDVIQQDTQEIHSSVSITAILCLSGLPADLTASILIHEATHAWFKLHPNYDTKQPIAKTAEEGCCQLLAMLFLTESLNYHKTETEETDEGPSDAKLRQYFRFCIETEHDEIYGTGYRIAAQVYSSIGLQQLLEYVVENKILPKI